MTYSKTFRTQRKWSKITKRDGVWILSNGYINKPSNDVLKMGENRTLAVISANTWLMN